MLSDNREELWELALRHAGLPGQDALLLEGRPSSGQGVAWCRGEELSSDEWLSEADAVRANKRRQAYRVSLHTDLTAPAFAAVARHELEHHLQYDRFGFDSVMIQHKRALATFAPADRVPGNGVLYNQIPMEADANAAGARFLLTLVDPAELGRLAGDDPSLSMFLDSAAPLMETLPERMERFINEDGPKLTEEFLRGRRP